MPIHEKVETLSRTKMSPSGPGSAIPSGGASVSGMADEVVDARKKIFVQRAAEKSISRALGDDEPKAPAGPQIDMKMDIGTLLTGLIGKMGDAQQFTMQMMQSAADERHKAIAESMNERVASLTERLEEARAGNSTETLLATIRDIRTLEKDLRAEAVPEARDSGMPASVYLEVEKLKLDFQERMAKWDADREESKRQWEAAERARHEEFLWQMKKFEVEREDAKETRKEQREWEEKKLRMELGDKAKKNETVSDMISAATRALDNAMNGGGEGQMSETRQPAGAAAASVGSEEFECQECHHKETVRSDIKEYTCPNCRTHYKDEPSKS